MTLELIVFIAAVLFGILLYWRESNGNGLYRFVNKLVNTKELRMKPEDKTGFIYQQKFLLRLVYITALFLVLLLILKFLIPINYTTVSIFASSIVGTLIGTYVANFVLRSGKVLDEKSDSITDIVKDTIDKGRDLLDDMKKKDEDVEKEKKEEEPSEPSPPEDSGDEKSARERLKDKGLL